MLVVRFQNVLFVLLMMSLSGCGLSASLQDLLSASKISPVKVDEGAAPINSINQGSYTFTGTCESDTSDFNIIAPFSENVTCNNGSWRVVKDLGSLPEGAVAIVTDLKDSNGKPIEFTLIKDTLPPVLTEMTLDFGKAYTKETLLNYSLTHTDGHQVYVTATAGCAAGGTWELLASSSLATIGSTEGVQTLYAKVKDLAGNESSCVSDSITLDITPPVVTGLANDAIPTKTKSWAWACTDVSSCRFRSLIDQSSSTTPTGAFSSATTTAQNSGDGIYYIHVQAEDEAGNIGSVVHVSAVLDNTGPSLSIGTPSPSTGNSSATFQWIISYTGAGSVGLADSDVTFSGTATAGCVASVTGAGTTSRTVSVTGCSGNGTLGISIAANTAQDALGNTSSAEGPSSTVVVNNVAPTYSVSSATPSTGVAATVFEWTVTYVGADTITLASGDIQYTSVSGTGAQNCAASIVTVSSLVRKVQITGCTGDGTFRLRIAAGSASNTAGNTAAGYTSSENVAVYNTPVIQYFLADVYGSYKTTDTPVLNWSAQSGRGTAPAKYEIAIGTTSGGTETLGWTDVGLVTTYVRTNLSLSYGTIYYARLRLTDTAGRVSAVSNLNFRSSWAGPTAVAYPDGQISTTTKDSSGRRIVGGSFTRIIQPIINASYLTGTDADGIFFSITHTLNGSISRQLEQADGKIIVVGSFTHAGSTESKYLARLNSDGSFDSSFVVQSGFSYTPSALAIQPDGKILLAGDFTSYKGVAASRMIRLNSDGTRDLSFDVGAGFNLNVASIAVQADGKILAAGRFTTFGGNSQKYLARLNNDGTIDSSLDLGTGFDNAVERVFSQSDGKIIVAGSFKTINGTARRVFARLNANGSLDTSFGGGEGFAYSTGPSVSVYAREVLQDSSGKFYVSGFFNRYDGAAVTGLVRMNNDGTLDTGFSMTIPDNPINVMAIQGTKLLVASSYSSAGRYSSLLRLNSNGALDSSFHYDQGDLDQAVNSILVRNSDGLVWLGGNFLSRRHRMDQRGIARFNTDGTFDTSFVSHFDVSGFNTVEKVIVQADGKILVQGSFLSYNFNSRAGILRLNIDGSLDSSFNPPTHGGIYSMALRADQKIYIGGEFDTNIGFSKVSLLNADGTVNNTLDGNDALDGDVTSLGMLSNGNLLIGGKFSSVGATTVKPLIVVDNSGALVFGFNWDGFTTETGVEVVKVEVDKAGEALVAATYDDVYETWNSGTSSYDYLPTKSLRVMRINLAGATYDSFNFQGDTNSAYLNAMATQPDGSILISASSFSDGSGSLRRYSGGAEDITFYAAGFSGPTCISAESNTSIFVGYGSQPFWKSRGFGGAGMSVISP